MNFFYTKKRMLQLAVLMTGIILMLFSNRTEAQKGLEFTNYVIHSGTPGENHCVYRFLSVSKGVDALVKIKKRSASNIVLENIDVDYTGFKNSFQPRIGPAGGTISGKADWWMDFEIRFVKSGTLTSVHVNTFYATALDVDGDGSSIREYVEMYKAVSYQVETPSLLKVTNLPDNSNEDEDDDNGKGRRFTAPVKNFVDIDTTATQVMATMKYKHSNKITLRIGALKELETFSNAAYRYNSIWFKSFEYVSASFLPVKLTVFTVVTDNKNAKLQWSTSSELNASHFVIQRSADGKDFKDVAILFTEGNSSLVRNYHYSDLVTNIQPLLYYRLKMVDLDGAFTYSATKVLKVRESGNEIKVLTYPNPVVSDLHITLPLVWQQQRIYVQISNREGQVIFNREISRASQTESISIAQLPKGLYLVRLSDGKEDSFHKIIKY